MPESGTLVAAVVFHALVVVLELVGPLLRVHVLLRLLAPLALALALALLPVAALLLLVVALGGGLIAGR